MYIISTSTTADLTLRQYWKNIKNFKSYSVNNHDDHGAIREIVYNDNNIIFILSEHFENPEFFLSNNELFKLIKIRVDNNLSCKVIYDYGAEGWFDSENFNILINFFTQELHLTLDDLLILCHINQYQSFNNYWLNDSIYLINWPEIDAYHWVQEKPEIFTLAPLFSRPNLLGITASKLSQKNWRSYFIKELYEKKLLDKALISVSGDIKEFGTLTTDKDFINLLGQRISYFGNTEPRYLNSNLGYTVEDSLNYGALTSSKPLYANCRLNCVLETSGVNVLNNDNYFHNRLTEKTYKAILNKSVFTVLGHPKIYNMLRLSGFNAFEDFINCDQFESMTNGKQIVESYVNITMSLLEQIPTNLDQMQEIVDFNYDFLITRAQKQYSDYQSVLNNFAKV